MADTRPNILLVMTDQQRGDCLGIDGHPVLQTPYLDHLAASGVRFSKAYSACPVCVPARRTIMTGRTAAHHGALVNAQAPLPWPTLPGQLRAAGYQTHLIGKSHWGPSPLETGFETMRHAGGPMAGPVGGELNDYQRFLRSQGIDTPRASEAHGIYGNGWPARPWHLEERLHFSNWVADEVLAFFEQRDGDRPFFLWANFIHPHQPLIPPRFYWDKYMAMDLPEPVVGDWARVFDGPVRGLRPECWRVSLEPIVARQMRAAYYACVEHIDHQIARFVAQRVLPRETIVVFASDHGEMLCDHQWIRKRNPYEPSARIPLLMRFPEAMGLPQQQVIDRPVELMDLMPTLLSAVGVDLPEGVDGSDLLPLIRDPAGPWRQYVHGECCHVPESGSGMQYLTDGRRKYVWLPGTGTERFFDLERDPQELHDLAGDGERADEVATWRRRLIAELNGRPEGFTDGERLLTLGGPTAATLPVWERA